jgi:hypothetical protein
LGECPFDLTRTRPAQPRTRTLQTHSYRYPPPLLFPAPTQATGVGLHPLAQALARALPRGSQRNSRALTVDDRLRVLGSGGAIYCLGDAATIDQHKALGHAHELFAEFDADKSGSLEVEELAALLNKAQER